MKKGFTLIEALMVLSIIGVVATILATTVANMKPDPELMRFRKAYMETRSVISELLSEEIAYKSVSATSSSTISVPPSWKPPCFVDLSIYDGATTANMKFAYYFSEKFNRFPAGEKTENTTNRTISFITYGNDGVFFKITDGFASNNFNSSSEILIGVNGVETGCEITDANCPVPTIFKLTVSPFGTITMASALNKYLQNPKITKFD